MDVNVTIRIDRIDDLIKAAGMLAGLHGEEESPAQKPYSAQIAQATLIPAQAMMGQASPAAPIAQPAQAATPAVPTAERGYTLDELAGAAMTLMDKGMQAQPRNSWRDTAWRPFRCCRRSSTGVLRRHYAEWGRRSDGA
ncbi:MAG: hypothetical protein ACLTT1_11300 [[Clostridium] scindens]